MPRRLEKNEQAEDMEVFMVSEYQRKMSVVFTAGILFLEMLSDVSAKRGNYHTVGQNRLGTKFLVTSNVQDSKFYAGGARLTDLLQELSEEYNWSDKMLEDALQAALRAVASEKGTK